MGDVRDLWDLGDPQVPAGFKNWGEAVSDAADRPHEVAYAELTSNSLGSSPHTHTGLALSSVPVVAGRVYEVRFEGTSLISGGGSGARIEHQIRVDADNVVRAARTDETVSGNSVGPFTIRYRFVASSTATRDFTFRTALIDGGSPSSVGVAGSVQIRPSTSVHDLGAS